MGFGRLLKTTWLGFLLVFKVSYVLYPTTIEKRLGKWKTLSNAAILLLLFGSVLFYPYFNERLRGQDDSGLVVNILTTSKGSYNSHEGYICRFSLSDMDRLYLLNMTLTHQRKHMLLSVSNGNVQKKLCQIYNGDGPVSPELKGTSVTIFYKDSIEFHTNDMGVSKEMVITSKKPLMFFVRNQNAILVEHSSDYLSLVRNVMAFEQDIRKSNGQTAKALAYSAEMSIRNADWSPAEFKLADPQIHLCDTLTMDVKNITALAKFEHSKTKLRAMFAITEPSLLAHYRTYVEFRGTISTSEVPLLQLNGKQVVKHEIVDKLRKGWLAKTGKILLLVGVVLCLLFVVLFVLNCISSSLAKKEKQD